MVTILITADPNLTAPVATSWSSWGPLWREVGQSNGVTVDGERRGSVCGGALALREHQGRAAFRHFGPCGSDAGLALRFALRDRRVERRRARSGGNTPGELGTFDPMWAYWRRRRFDA
jgi:hypothetical protein